MVQYRGQTFRLGIWSVKPENSEDFINAWQVSTDWLTDKLGYEGLVVLLSDRDDPTKYVSFASVPDLENVEKVMAQTEFQELWAEVMKYCDTVKPHVMSVVGSVGRR
jgi:hypothetical protein